MINRFLLLALVLTCVRAEAQDIVGTPLNVPYATLLEWLFAPAPNKKVMPDWIKSELVRHARSEHKEFARSVRVTLLGTNPETPCDVTKFAMSKSAPDGKPEIVFCVRAIQYTEQISRALQLHSLNEQFKDENYGRRTQLMDRYFNYLNRLMNADRDVADDPRKFLQFCSIEFYMLVNALGFFGNDCPPEAIVKHSIDFNRFFSNGGFLPDPLFIGKSAAERQEAIGNYVQSTQTSEWRGIWRAAALHEFGHLVSCHQGTFPGLRCRIPVLIQKASSSLHDEPLEIEADGYVLSSVVIANPDNLEKILATASELMVHSLSRAFWTQGTDLRLHRLAANQDKYKSIYRRVFADKEFTARFQKNHEPALRALREALQ